MKYSLKRACLHHLRATFGVNAYRPGQKAAVHALLSGRDVLCILPTGAGKSLCWQLPAVVHPGLTVVVSPLIALMRDQVQHLASMGIPAISLDSLMSPEEKTVAVEMLRQGMVRIVFVSPERLQQKSFRRLCAEQSPWLLVVDEAHCVVQWGESFRPAYGEIQNFVRELPRRPVVCALTATANAAMQSAMADSLELHRPKRILLPALRPNLVYRVLTTLDRTEEILRLVQRHPCKTVVFCRSRSRTESLAAYLKGTGIEAASYHAGLERSERMAVQQIFQEGRVQILCATTAFGLGVDIPDIRRVIHDYLPDNLIDYVQQSGRAGRDEMEAECILLIEPNDLVSKAASMQKQKHDKFLRRWLRLRKKKKELRQLLRVVLQERCIPAGISAAFGRKTAPCGRCSACRKGALTQEVPTLGGMRPHEIRAWVLLWQRDALARQRGVRPEKILPAHAIHRAARHLVFPGDVAAPAELERLLVHFRRGWTHNSDADGIT